MSASDPLVDVPIRDSIDGARIVWLESFRDVDAKVRRLAELASAGARRRRVDLIARSLRTIERAHAFVRDRVRYEDEPTEMLETPAFVLEAGAGDCEGQAVTLAALAVVLEHAAVLVPMGGTPDDPAHLAIAVSTERARRPALVTAGAWQPWGLEAPAGFQWAETTVRAELGEAPIAAAMRLGAARADLGG